MRNYTFFINRRLVHAIIMALLASVTTACWWLPPPRPETPFDQIEITGVTEVGDGSVQISWNEVDSYGYRVLFWDTNDQFYETELEEGVLSTTIAAGDRSQGGTVIVESTDFFGDSAYSEPVNIAPL